MSKTRLDRFHEGYVNLYDRVETEVTPEVRKRIDADAKRIDDMVKKHLAGLKKKK